MQSTVGLVTSPRYLDHLTGPGHPERPARLTAIQERLVQDGLLSELRQIPPRACTEDEARLVHSPGYLQIAQRDIAAGYGVLSTGDTNICRDSWEIACLAAGGVIAAVDAVMEQQVHRAFCAVRPPGHHATPTLGMGFCILGNVAIAARYAQQKFGIGKVLIVDWDVHHGNGTQDTFYEDDSVLFFSTHQHPWYPGTGMREETGAGRGLGTTINVPLPAGSGSREIFAAFQDLLLPAAHRFRPEFILISAGFDSRVGDPLGQFRLSDEDFATLTHLVIDLAGEHAEHRLVSVLEGGYSLTGVAAATAAHVRAMLHPRPNGPYAGPGCIGGNV